MDGSPEQLTPCKGSPPSSVQKTRKTAFMSESKMSPTDPHVGKSPLGHGTYLMGVGHSGPRLLCFLFHCHIPSLWMVQPLQPSFSSMGNRNELKRSLFASPSVVSVGYFCHIEEKHQFIQWPDLIKKQRSLLSGNSHHIVAQPLCGLLEWLWSRGMQLNFYHGNKEIEELLYLQTQAHKTLNTGKQRKGH